MAVRRVRAGRLGVTVLAAAMAVPGSMAAQGAAPDTLRLEVGSPEIDGRILPDHSARNRVVGQGTAPVNTWTTI